MLLKEYFPCPIKIITKTLPFLMSCIVICRNPSNEKKLISIGRQRLCTDRLMSLSTVDLFTFVRAK